MAPDGELQSAHGTILHALNYHTKIPLALALRSSRFSFHGKDGNVGGFSGLGFIITILNNI